MASDGTWKLLSRSSAWPWRRPLGPARQPSRPPVGAPRVLMPTPRVFAASSCHVDETLADLIDFLSPTLAGFLSSFLSPGFLSAGRCKVPSAALAAGAAAGSG